MMTRKCVVYSCASSIPSQGLPVFPGGGSGHVTPRCFRLRVGLLLRSPVSLGGVFSLDSVCVGQYRGTGPQRRAKMPRSRAAHGKGEAASGGGCPRQDGSPLQPGAAARSASAGSVTAFCSQLVRPAVDTGDQDFGRSGIVNLAIWVICRWIRREIIPTTSGDGGAFKSCESSNTSKAAAGDGGRRQIGKRHAYGGGCIGRRRIGCCASGGGSADVDGRCRLRRLIGCYAYGGRIG